MLKEEKKSDRGIERVKLAKAESDKDQNYALKGHKPKKCSIVTFMLGMALVEFAQKDLTGS